ncbi:hypothetical protein E4U36_003399 [Claviceps purpurea]|nr:hypothetical protein E4U36_003399 [Claviceps purpurea]
MTILAVDSLEPLGLEALLQLKTGHRFTSAQSQTNKAMKYRNKKPRVEKSSAGSTTTGADNPHMRRPIPSWTSQTAMLLSKAGSDTSWSNGKAAACSSPSARTQCYKPAVLREHKCL